MNVYPKVTIAIPTFNRSHFVLQAVRSALNQTYKNIEVVVSDNGSTDDTYKKLTDIKDGRLTVFRHQTNQGMMTNWNICLGHASGELFLMLSDDDLLSPLALEKMVGILVSPPKNVPPDNIAFVYCHSEIVDGDGTRRGFGEYAPCVEPAFDAIKFFFRGRRSTFPCSMLFRTGDLRQAGGYDAVRYPLGADADVWIKIALMRGMVVFARETLCTYRVHSSNVTSQVKVEEWLRNNNNLASHCAEYYLARGELKKSKEISRLIPSLNARVAAALVMKHSDGHLNLRLLGRVLDLKEYFHGYYGLSLALFYSIEIFIAKSVRGVYGRLQATFALLK